MSNQFVVNDENAHVLFKLRPPMTTDEIEMRLVSLDKNDLNLLCFLHRHSFMTRFQIERLFINSTKQSKRRLKFLDKIRVVNRLRVSCSVPTFPPIYMLDIAGARYLNLKKWSPDVLDFNSICKYLQLVEIYLLLSPGVSDYRVRPVFKTHRGFYVPMAVFNYTGINGRERKLIFDIFRPGDNNDLDRKIGYLCALLDEPTGHFDTLPAVVLDCCDEDQIRAAARHLAQHARKVAFTTDDRLYGSDVNKSFLVWNGRDIEPMPDQGFFLPQL
ncbi:MAG: hypothetical protein HPY50_02425 [Firmicutes bacterium]|nr:hypothetical protein [Bacillota bacterium]